MNFRLHALVFALALLLATMPAAVAQIRPTDEFTRGVQLYELGDKKGTIASYTAWLEKNSQDAQAYYNRGVAKSDLGDYDDAIADYDHVVKLDPNYVNAYVNRGNAKLAKGDNDAAIADYDNVIKLDPKFLAAYNNRGVAKRAMGDNNAAIADYELAIGINPKFAQAYHNRGVDLYLQKNWLKARADFDTASEQEHGALMACVVQTRLGQGEEGRKQLSIRINNRLDTKLDDWVSRLGKFLLGTLDEEALLRDADSPNVMKSRVQRCEAWYYAGMQHLAAGQKTEAANCFRKSVATEQKTVDEYALAAAELKWLEAK